MEIMAGNDSLLSIVQANSTSLADLSHIINTTSLNDTDLLNDALSNTTGNETTPTTNKGPAVPEGCLPLDYIPYINPQNVIDIDTMLMFYKILPGAIIPLICLLGTPANVVNCLVFFRQGLRERINFLLFCLSCTDCVVSVFLFVSTIEYFYTQIQGAIQINGPLVQFLTNYGSIVYGSVYVSGFITTLISLERCLCITHPMLAKHVLKTKTMAIVVVVTSVLLIAFIYLVSAEKYRIRCGYFAPYAMTLDVHYPSDFYIENEVLMDILNGVLYGVMLPSFFALTTAITTTITAVKLREVANWRQNQATAGSAAARSAGPAMESKEIALTKMLIAVSALFVVCTVPNVVLRIAPLLVDEFRLGGRKQNLLLSGICVIYLANAFNSAFNFVFYYKMGSRFRAGVGELFSCCGGGGGGGGDGGKGDGGAAATKTSKTYMTDASISIQPQ